jgi:hypothetical protein
MASLKFRVLLDSKDQEKVFRDIIIGENENFETLYKTIISSFNFKGDQMASFYISNDDWDKGHEISLMDLSYGDDAIDDLPSVMNSAILKDFMEDHDQKIILVYDFLKMWIFLVELIGTEEKETLSPEIILSIGVAPIESTKEEISNDLNFDQDLYQTGEDEDEDEDDFGFNDYEDGFSDEDISGYDSYDY